MAAHETIPDEWNKAYKNLIGSGYYTILKILNFEKYKKSKSLIRKMKFNSFMDRKSTPHSKELNLLIQNEF